jgi:hypothetical protein
MGAVAVKNWQAGIVGAGITLGGLFVLGWIGMDAARHTKVALDGESGYRLTLAVLPGKAKADVAQKADVLLVHHDTPVANANIGVTVFGSDGKVITTKKVTTDANGMASFTVLNPSAGILTIQAEYAVPKGLPLPAIVSAQWT